MGVYALKVGDALPPTRRAPRPCPKCGDEVFKEFATGFTDEIDIVSTHTPNGFNVKEHWHCPKCGHRENKFHEVDTNGLRIQPKPNSSYKPKKKRKRQK